MPLAGAIADRARGIVPVTWDALSKDVRFGDALLQVVVNTAKELVTGTVISEDSEKTYPLIVIDYIAKVAVMELIPAGVDYWMNESMSETSTGTNESVSFTDRARTLLELRTQLLEETRTSQPQVAQLIGFWRDNGRAIPVMSTGTINPYHNTPSPEEFPRPYAPTQYS